MWVSTMKIDFGSGYNPRSGYKTCDVTDSPALDYVYDTKTQKIVSKNNRPIKSESVDVIRVKNVLHHIPVLEPVLKEFFRVLKIRGKIIVIEPTKESYRSNWILDNLWYRFVIPRPEVWFSSIYRDYKNELRLWFTIYRNVVKSEKEYTVFVK